MADLSKYSNAELIGMLNSSQPSSTSLDISSVPTNTLLNMLGTRQPTRPMWKDIGTSIAQGASFGFADEGAAAVRSLIPKSLVPSFGNSYEQELQAIRGGQKKFSQEHPYVDFAANLAGGIGTGAGLAAKGLNTVAGLTGLTRATAAAKEGAALGSLYGFGQGEGGLTERTKSAGKGALLGGVASGGLSLAGQGLTKASGKLGTLADDIKPSTAEEKTIQSLGITESAYTKANRFAKAKAPENNPLVQSLEFAKTKGIFKDSPDPETILSRVEVGKDQLDDSITSILKKADKSQTDIPELPFSNAKKYIENHIFEEDQLATQFEKRLNTINSKWDGSISGLNEIKRKIGKPAFSTTADSRGLDRALYTDLREAVEASADKFGGQGLGEKVRLLNQDKQKLINLEPVIEKAKNKTLKEATAAPKNNILSQLYDAAAIAQYAMTSSPSMLVAKAGIGVAKSDLGRKAISNAMSKAGEGTSLLSNLAQSPTGIIPSISGITHLGISNRTKEPEKKQANSNSFFNLQNDSSKALPYKKADLAESLASFQNAARQGKQEKYIGLSQSPNSRSPQVNNTSLNSSTLKNGNQGKTDRIFSLVVDAIAQVESSGNPKAIGAPTKWGTAKGKYQVLDHVGKAYHKKLGLPGKYDPFNENQQRKIAEALLMDNYEALDGDMSKAVLAYHSGVGNVKAGKIGKHGKAYVPAVSRVFERLIKNA